jgi:single stranded DNA-binding protein
MSNTISLTGNASVKSELGSTKTGKPAFTFSVADTTRKQQGDEWVNGETTWVEVPTYEKLAERAAELVKDGQRVTVVGRLETVNFTDRENTVRTKLVLHPDEIALNIRFGLK